MTDEIDQDVREAAAELMRLFLSSNILSDDDVEVAFARMKAAGREQGLREAAEAVENLPWDESRVGNANFDDTKEYAVKAITALIGG